jgi:peptidoglycan hydrolase-like protein with peptidoglycan-binding domain
MVQEVRSGNVYRSPQTNPGGLPTGYTAAPSLLDVIQGTGTMMRGQAGPGIADLQRILNEMGANPPLALDGKFGPKTEAALKAFQGGAGVNDNGKFGRDSMLAVQTHQAYWNQGGFDYRKYGDATNAERNMRAPQLDDPTPPGTMKAGDLAAADQARRARTNPQAPEVSGDGRNINLHSQWYSQFDPAHVEGAGNSACYRAVRAMGRASGINVPPGTGDRIQVATGEDSLGRVQTTPDRTRAARSYIDQQLEAGRPVAVGVSHKQADYNADGITDHFVMITGRGTDAQGRQFYTYNDPATRNAEAGQNNRFYVDPQSGNLVHEGSLASGYVRDRHTELSMVVRSS